MTVRFAKLQDYQFIHALNRTAFGYEYPLDKTKERLEILLSKPSHRLFVACQDSMVIGYIHGCDYDCTYSDPLKNIMAVAVDERFRGTGTGKLLLETLEGWAREDGCAGIRLVSGMNREQAHGFYLHCGYTLRKEQKNFIKYFAKESVSL